MNTSKSVTIISASPKMSEASVSEWLSQRAGSLIGGDGVRVEHINVRSSLAKKQTAQDFDTMLASDALVFIFPLYIFCLPGLLMRYLQDFYAYFQNNPQASTVKMVYTAVNCGFHESNINEEAVRVVKSFSEKINARFRFGLMIGGGGMLLDTHGAPFMKKIMTVIDNSFVQMRTDIISENEMPVENIETKPSFPRWLYYFSAHRGWFSLARKNGLKRHNIYAQPYR